MLSVSFVFPSVRPTAASPDLKIVASYLAIPAGQYVTKHSSINVVVGSFDVTGDGDFSLRIPFEMRDPSQVQ